jgi:hypothetical protein
MRAWLKKASEFLWIPAVVSCAVGVAGMADYRQPELLGLFIIGAPHFGEVILTAWACGRHPLSAVVALAGSLTVTGLTWWDKLTPPPVDELGFDVAFRVLFVISATYLVFITALLAAVVIPWFESRPGPTFGNFQDPHLTQRDGDWW